MIIFVLLFCTYWYPFTMDSVFSFSNALTIPSASDPTPSESHFHSQLSPLPSPLAPPPPLYPARAQRTPPPLPSPLLPSLSSSSSSPRPNSSRFSPPPPSSPPSSSPPPPHPSPPPKQVQYSSHTYLNPGPVVARWLLGCLLPFLPLLLWRRWGWHEG